MFDMLFDLMIAVLRFNVSVGPVNVDTIDMIGALAMGLTTLVFMPIWRTPETPQPILSAEAIREAGGSLELWNMLYGKRCYFVEGEPVSGLCGKLNEWSLRSGFGKVYKQFSFSTFWHLYTVGFELVKPCRALANRVPVTEVEARALRAHYQDLMGKLGVWSISYLHKDRHISLGEMVRHFNEINHTELTLGEAASIMTAHAIRHGLALPNHYHDYDKLTAALVNA